MDLGVCPHWRGLVVNKAIGVVLSGGGTDGTLGLEEISAADGVTFAQDERSAKHLGGRLRLG